jgi:hypothetical protein
MTSRLIELSINDLFGMYSHQIPLHQDRRVTIIIGPNGFGKTVCLRFIEALFRHNYSYFLTVPFASAEFVFTGGEAIRLETVTEPGQSGVGSVRSVIFILKVPGTADAFWEPAPKKLDDAARRELRRYVPPNYRQTEIPSATEIGVHA